jgi:hypothetical protein
MLITSVPSNLIVESEEMKLALPINEVDDGFVSLAEVRGAIRPVCFCVLKALLTKFENFLFFY